MRRSITMVGFALLFAAPEARAAGSCVPGFAYGAFSKNCTLKVTGTGSTDSYDSSLGPYATSGTSTGGNVGTNGTANNCVDINGGGTINGTIDVGPTGGTSSVSGSAFQGAPNPNVMSTPLGLPSVVIPTVGTNQGNQSGGNISLAADQTYDDVSIAGGGTLTLSSGQYVMKSLSLAGSSTIALNITTGPVVIYITNGLDLSGGTVSNATNKSTNLLFFVGSGVGNIKLAGGTDASYGVYAPDSDIDVTGNADVFGALVGKTVTLSGNATIHYDKALANVSAGGFTCTSNEVSRATPVIATVEGTSGAIVQGTFETAVTAQPAFTTVAQLGTWSFPWLKGHVRARVASTVSTSSFSSGTVLFDAGATGNIPPANNSGCGTFNTSCRQVFTNTNTPDGTTTLPTVVQLNDGSSSTVGGIITGALTGFGATEWQTIVRAVIAGGLGGVDRSTVAVIEQSNVAGTIRPRMAYFGATDGMLHAVCASTISGSACPIGSLGKELWAFLPNVQLPLIPGNATRVDGSVHVADVFGKFPTPVASSPYAAPTVATSNSFRTILTFQTGFAFGTKPAAYALDITDPSKPVLLWEHATPSTPASVDFGTGLTSTGGPTIVAGVTKNLAVFETNNGGSSSLTTVGMVTTALNTVDGTLAWQFTHTYPLPPRGDGTALMPVPSLSIPGGAVGVDLSGGSLGFITDYVMGDLYGSLWRLDAVTGSPPTTGTGFTCTLGGSALANCVPIFSMSTNKRPIGTLPVIFQRVAGGEQFAGFATGGYVDPVATTWSTTDQKLIAVKLRPTAVPADDTVAACTAATCDMIVNATFTNSNDRAFAQAQIIGTKLLVTADSTDVNAAGYGTGTTPTGSIYSADILAGATTVLATPQTVFRGAGAIVNDDANNIAYTGLGDSKVTDKTGGIKIDPASGTKFSRRMWAKTQN